MTERLVTKKGSWGFDYPSNYDDIVSTIGTILVSEDEDNYQGDSLYLIENGGRIGFVTVGWGSCSGCDALEAASSQDDINEIQDDIERGVKWFDSRDEANAYVASDAMDSSWLNATLLRDFRAAVAK